MRIVHLHKTDLSGGGGGAISMHRLHCALRQAGVESTILGNVKTLDSPHTKKISNPGMTLRVEHFLRKFTKRLGLNDIHAVGTFKLKDDAFFQKADIFHIHGIHGNFFNYLALPQLTNQRPTIFTLCDMWAFTGHCTYSFECARWKSGCGQCPYPDDYPKIDRDGTHLEWKLKKWVYNRSNLVIVTKSKWLTELAQQSMLSHFPIYHIPNGLDTELYRPLDSELCRDLLGIPPNKKVLMFTALNMTNRRKGGDLLLEALQHLPESLKSEIVLLLLGKGGTSFDTVLDLPVIDLGFTTGDRLKAIAFSAADLFLFPTRADTLGNVAIESIACGTPVVSFDVGGVPDVVRPGVTGYLAEPENSADLSRGIVQLLEDDKLRNELSRQGRRIALQEYTIDLWVQRYTDLYHHLLTGSISEGFQLGLGHPVLNSQDEVPA